MSAILIIHPTYYGDRKNETSNTFDIKNISILILNSTSMTEIESHYFNLQKGDSQLPNIEAINELIEKYNHSENFVVFHSHQDNFLFKNIKTKSKMRTIRTLNCLKAYYPSLQAKRIIEINELLGFKTDNMYPVYLKIHLSSSITIETIYIALLVHKMIKDKGVTLYELASCS